MITDIITYRKASHDERVSFIESFLKGFLISSINYTIPSTYRGPDELRLVHNVNLTVQNGVIDCDITSILNIKEGVLKILNFRPQLHPEIAYISKQMNAIWNTLLSRYNIIDKFDKICFYGDKVDISGMFQDKKRIRIYNNLLEVADKKKSYRNSISFEIEFDGNTSQHLDFKLKANYKNKDSLKPIYKTYKATSFEEVEIALEKIFYLMFFKEEYDLGRFTSKRLDLVKMFNI